MMKQKAIATPIQRTEPISFERVTPVSDGASGSTGEASIVNCTLATVKPIRSSRLLENNQTTLRQGYEFEVWVNPDFEPVTGDTILYRDERLTIEQYRYTDTTRLKYLIIALEQVQRSTVI